MKLDVNQLRYLSKDDFRVLQAVELGQKNVRSYSGEATLLNCIHCCLWMQANQCCLCFCSTRLCRWRS